MSKIIQGVLLEDGQIGKIDYRSLENLPVIEENFYYDLLSTLVEDLNNGQLGTQKSESESPAIKVTWGDAGQPVVTLLKDVSEASFKDSQGTQKNKMYILKSLDINLNGHTLELGGEATIENGTDGTNNFKEVSLKIFNGNIKKISTEQLGTVYSLRNRGVCRCKKITFLIEADASTLIGVINDGETILEKCKITLSNKGAGIAQGLKLQSSSFAPIQIYDSSFFIQGKSTVHGVSLQGYFGGTIENTTIYTYTSANKIGCFAVADGSKTTDAESYIFIKNSKLLAEGDASSGLYVSGGNPSWKRVVGNSILSGSKTGVDCQTEIGLEILSSQVYGLLSAYQGYFLVNARDSLFSTKGNYSWDGANELNVDNIHYIENTNGADGAIFVRDYDIAQAALDNCQIDTDSLSEENAVLKYKSTASGVSGNKVVKFSRCNFLDNKKIYYGDSLAQIYIGRENDIPELYLPSGATNPNSQPEFTTDLYREFQENQNLVAWIDLENKTYAKLEKTSSLYADLKTAFDDINNKEVGKNVTWDIASAKVKVSWGDNGRLTVLLLDDISVNERLTINYPLDFVMCGHSVEFTKGSTYFIIVGESVHFFGGFGPDKMLEYTYPANGASIYGLGKRGKISSYIESGVSKTQLLMNVCGKDCCLEGIDFNLIAEHSPGAFYAIVGGKHGGTSAEGVLMGEGIGEGLKIKNCRIRVEKGAHSNTLHAVTGIRMQRGSTERKPLTIENCEITVINQSPYGDGIRTPGGAILKNTTINVSAAGEGTRFSGSQQADQITGVDASYFEGVNCKIVASCTATAKEEAGVNCHAKVWGVRSPDVKTRDLSITLINNDPDGLSECFISGLCDNLTIEGGGITPQNKVLKISNSHIEKVPIFDAQYEGKICLGENCSFAEDITSIPADKITYTGELYRNIGDTDQSIGKDFNVLTNYLNNSILSQLALIVDGGA